MSDKVNDRVKQILVSKMLKDMKPEDIGDDTPLIELGVGVDSVATLELIVALEKEFQISIDESDVNLHIGTYVSDLTARFKLINTCDSKGIPLSFKLLFS